MEGPSLIRTKLRSLLAFTRIPGNALSFWIRQTLRWSRGMPGLPQESKDRLFEYLEGFEDFKDRAATAEARESVLRTRYRLEPLAQASTAALYRKNLYLLDTLEQASEGLPMPGISREGRIKALDVGSQDWHYVFGLERWLRFRNPVQGGQGGQGGHATPIPSAPGRPVDLTGLELDGYGIYADFHSRRDYAHAYAAQTANPDVRYEIGDFLKRRDGGFDVVTIFYPFVTRYHLLLWGLPLRFFSPPDFLSRAADLTLQGGWLVVYCHTLREHELFLALGRATKVYTLLREGPVLSDLVDFHEEVRDRRFSIWKKS